MHRAQLWSWCQDFCLWICVHLLLSFTSIQQHHQTSYIVARILLMTPIVPWRNSTPFLGEAAQCSTKNKNFIKQPQKWKSPQKRRQSQNFRLPEWGRLPQNEYKPKNENYSKSDDNRKIKTTKKMRTISKMKMIIKRETTSKMRTNKLIFFIGEVSLYKCFCGAEQHQHVALCVTYVV